MTDDENELNRESKILVSAMEMVNSPSHYNVGNIETIDYLESLNIAEDFCCGNAIKYLSRYKHKGTPLEDAKKAQWYVNRLVQILETNKETK